MCQRTCFLVELRTRRRFLIQLQNLCIQYTYQIKSMIACVVIYPVPCASLCYQNDMYSFFFYYVQQKSPHKLLCLLSVSSFQHLSPLNVNEYLSRARWSYHSIRHQQGDFQLQKDEEDNYIAVVPSEIPPLPTWMIGWNDREIHGEWEKS